MSDELAEEMWQAVRKLPWGNIHHARTCAAVAHEHYADLIAAAKETVRVSLNCPDSLFAALAALEAEQP